MSMAISAPLPMQRHRAMAGLSMGGFETKLIAPANLDKFAYIGLFSGGTFSLDDVNRTPGFKDKVKLVFVSFGSRELGRAAAPAPPGAPPSDPRANAEALEERRLQQRLLRVAQYRARIPVLAAEPARIRAVAVPGLRREFWRHHIQFAQSAWPGQLSIVSLDFKGFRWRLDRFAR